MPSSKLFARGLSGKIQLKLVAFVLLFLAVSAVVTGFFATNQPKDTKEILDQQQVQKLAEEYKKNQVLPKDIKFSKIKEFQVINRRDTLIDARIVLENQLAFTLIDMAIEGKYFPNAAKVAPADQDGVKNLEEYIVPEVTYYKYLNDEVWFVKYIDNKESGVFLPVYGENGGFEKESKLKFL